MKDLINSEVWQDFNNTTRQALRDLMKMGIKEKAQYWMSPRELFARAFEGYVSYKLEEKGRENTYLSGGSEGLMWCNKEQKEKMAPLFDKIFKELRESDYIEKALNLDNDLKKGDSDKRYQFKNNKDQDNIRLYRGLTQPFNPKFNLAHSDAPHGYSTWTDNEELARQYSGKDGHVYYMDLPKSKMGSGAIDENPKSETYGDRHLFFLMISQRD